MSTEAELTWMPVVSKVRQEDEMVYRMRGAR